MLYLFVYFMFIVFEFRTFTDCATLATLLEYA